MKSRLWAASALAAVVAVAVLVVVVLKFGRVDPSPPSLRNHPRDEIPGRIAYREIDGCAVVIDASGRNSKEVTCDIGYPITWVDGDTIAYGDGFQPSPRWHEVDIETGVQRPGPPVSFDGGPQSVVSARGETALVGNDGELYIGTDSGREQIAAFDGSGSSLPNPVLWSPDGDWILLTWSSPRGGDHEIWIVKRDGSVKGTLVTDAGYGSFESISWFIEGVGIEPGVPAYRP